jgi:hypothetical protein
VRPAIYSDHTAHYKIMQMVDDTRVRADMGGSAAPIIDMQR